MSKMGAMGDAWIVLAAAVIILFFDLLAAKLNNYSETANKTRKIIWYPTFFMS